MARYRVTTHCEVLKTNSSEQAAKYIIDQLDNMVSVTFTGWDDVASNDIMNWIRANARDSNLEMLSKRLHEGYLYVRDKWGGCQD